MCVVGLVDMIAAFKLVQNDNVSGSKLSTSFLFLLSVLSFFLHIAFEEDTSFNTKRYNEKSKKVAFRFYLSYTSADTCLPLIATVRKSVYEKIFSN